MGFLAFDLGKKIKRNNSWDGIFFLLVVCVLRTIVLLNWGVSREKVSGIPARFARRNDKNEEGIEENLDQEDVKLVVKTVPVDDENGKRDPVMVTGASFLLRFILHPRKTGGTYLLPKFAQGQSAGLCFEYPRYNAAGAGSYYVLAGWVSTGHLGPEPRP